MWNVLSTKVRAQHIPLPEGLGQVKLPVGQVDLSQVFFNIPHKQSARLRKCVILEVKQVKHFWLFRVLQVYKILAV